MWSISCRKFSFPIIFIGYISKQKKNYKNSHIMQCCSVQNSGCTSKNSHRNNVEKILLSNILKKVKILWKHPPMTLGNPWVAESYYITNCSVVCIERGLGAATWSAMGATPSEQYKQAHNLRHSIPAKTWSAKEPTWESNWTPGC